MRRPSPSVTLLIIDGLFWDLAAGFLPYPVLVVLGLGAGFSGFLPAIQLDRLAPSLSKFLVFGVCSAFVGFSRLCDPCCYEYPHVLGCPIV